MGIKQTITLRTAFWKFLVLLLLGLFLAVVVPFGGMMLGTNMGIATYSNYSEQSAQNIAPILATAPDVSKVQLPVACKYLLLDKNYQLIQTTLSDRDLEQAMEYAKTGTTNKNLNKQYLLVTRENEFIVLQYYIGSQFTNEWLNQHLPSPDSLLYLCIAINCVLVCVFLTARFAKNLRAQLLPLFSATEQVAQQNLDFAVGHSKIKEFEEVLVSFSHMKDSLKTSLEQQWKAEQTQREQLAALAHDLKTPLTVIQGNADLISETNLNTVQQRYADYIMDSSQQMQQYIKALIEISRAVAGYQFRPEMVEFPAFLKKTLFQIQALCEIKQIHLNTNIADIPQQITADKVLLERAILNVLNNALDFSPQDGTIFIALSTQNKKIQFSITDQGEGFFAEALHHAKEQFYMADQSRNGNLHFGMGLYIANSIVEQHGGQLHLGNSAETGGATVTIQIPC